MSTPPTPSSRKAIVIAASCAAITALGVAVILTDRPSPEVASPVRQQKQQNESTAPAKTRASAKTLLDRAAPLSAADRLELKEMQLNPADAESLLERSKREVKGISDRAILASSILQALCDSGHEKEAWDLIEDDLGMVREFGLYAVFFKSGEPMDALVARFGNLTEPNERLQAINGLLSNRPSEVVALDFSKLKLNGQMEQRMAGTAIQAMLENSAKTLDPEMGKQLLEKSIDLVKGKVLDMGFLTHMLEIDRINDPLDRWSIINSNKDGLDPKDLERLQSTNVIHMIDQDLYSGMQAICTEPSTRYSVPILNRAIKKMYEADPARANEWMTNELPKVDPASGQRIIVGVGQAAIRNGELDVARQWAEKLVNPEVKAQLAKQIQEAETAKGAAK